MLKNAKNIVLFQKLTRLCFPYFATKLCNLTNFRMLFLAVLINFILLTKVKIESIIGIVQL